MPIFRSNIVLYNNTRHTPQLQTSSPLITGFGFIWALFLISFSRGGLIALIAYSPYWSHCLLATCQVFISISGRRTAGKRHKKKKENNAKEDKYKWVSNCCTKWEPGRGCFACFPWGNDTFLAYCGSSSPTQHHRELD